MTVISVIVGSTRQGRFSEKPAQWIFQQLKNRGSVDARLLDLRDFPMPFFDQPVPPAMPGRPAYENEVVKNGRSRCPAAPLDGNRASDRSGPLVRLYSCRDALGTLPRRRCGGGVNGA
jgi:hypothetical protein